MTDVMATNSGHREMPAWAKRYLDMDRSGFLEASHRVAFLGDITNCASTGSWSELNDVLANWPVSETSTSAQILILRGTFRFKSKLSAWDELLVKIRGHLDSVNAKSASLLRGLS